MPHTTLLVCAWDTFQFQLREWNQWGFRLFQQLINRELRCHQAGDTPRAFPMFISFPILTYSHSSFSLVYCLAALFTPGVSACRRTMGRVSTSAPGCLNDGAFRRWLALHSNCLGYNGLVESLEMFALQILGSFSRRNSFRPWQFLVLNWLILSNWSEVCCLFIHLAQSGWAPSWCLPCANVLGMEK